MVIRILVALEDDYRAYREVIAAGLLMVRPGAKVKSAALEVLEEELERFDPQVVICSARKALESNGSRAWIELPLDPTKPTKISVDGRYLEVTDPSVEDLLKIIDEME